MWKCAQTCCSFPPCKYYLQWADWHSSSPCRPSRAARAPGASSDCRCSWSHSQPSGWRGMRCAVRTACCPGRPSDLKGFKQGEVRWGRSHVMGNWHGKRNSGMSRMMSNPDIKSKQSVASGVSGKCSIRGVAIRLKGTQIRCGRTKKTCTNLY